MLFTVRGREEWVLEFYRTHMYCQKYSFTSTCPPFSCRRPSASKDTAPRIFQKVREASQQFKWKTVDFSTFLSCPDGSVLALPVLILVSLVF